MRLRKLTVIVLFLFMLLSVSGIISADSCRVTERASCGGIGDNIVMGFYKVDNSHGELASVGISNYVLCCDFGTGDTTCDATNSNRIVRLLKDSNSHAETPEGIGYGFDVCYEDLVCVSSVTGCTAEYDIPVVSLTASANAHLGGFNNYATNVCCKHSIPLQICGDGFINVSLGEMCDDGNTVSGDGCSNTCQLETEAFWSLNGETAIFNLNVVPDQTSILMLALNTGLSEGTLVDFKIYEYDLGSDGLVSTINGVVLEDGSVNASWTITQIDLDTAGASLLEGELEDFYFVVNGQGSNDLNITITLGSMCSGIDLCMKYPDQSSCEADNCAIANNSTEMNNPGISCGGDIACSCVWSGTQCSSSYSITKGFNCGDGELSAGEQCDTNLNNLTCSNFDSFTGGILSCSSCIATTSQCTGGTIGVCGDGNINTGEQCDGTNMSVVSCTDFGFTGGSVSCSNCLIDTSACVGGYVLFDLLSIGSCSYTESTEGDTCEDGLLSYSWGADWQWDISNVIGSNPGGEAYILGTDGQWHYDPDGESLECVSGKNIIPCPDQVMLPFFGVFNIILTLSLISLTYIILILKKRGFSID